MRLTPPTPHLRTKHAITYRKDSIEIIWRKKQKNMRINQGLDGKWKSNQKRDTKRNQHRQQHIFTNLIIHLFIHLIIHLFVYLF